MIDPTTVRLPRTVYEGYCTKCGLWRTQTAKELPEKFPCPRCGRTFERLDVLGTALCAVPWTQVAAGRFVNPFSRPVKIKGVEGDLDELQVAVGR